MSKYMVMTASAQMPFTCWGKYKRVAVVELQEGFSGVPTMISNRANGVKAVIKTWERLNVGRTEKCAYQRALQKAHRLVKQLED